MDPYAKLLASHRSLTEDTWSLLADRGVSASTPLVLDYRYEAPNRAKAQQLVVALVELSASVDLERSGRLLHPHWVVSGSFRPRCFDEDSMVGWVEMMVILGRTYDSYFDGFGTSIP